MDTLLTARLGVPETGEKEIKKKMNRKPIATIILAILLMSTFGGLGSLISVHGDTYYTLTMTYAPNPMLGSVVPDLLPAVGPHSYTMGSTVNITAPAIVSAGSGVRYVFDNWTFYSGPYQNVSAGVTTTNPYDVYMSEDYTAVAMYHLEYQFTVTTAFDTAWIYDPSFGWRVETSRWFDAGTVGVRTGLSVGLVNIEPSHQAVFTSWTGDVSGTSFGQSSACNMTGPKAAVANWVVQYYLWTGSTYTPWAPGTPYNPAGPGWYDTGTDVALTAPHFDNVNPSIYRYVLDKWEIKNWNYTGGFWYVVDTRYTDNITVHMDQTKLCMVYFKLQYYLTVATSPSYVPSGVETQSAYFYYGSNATLTAPLYVADPSNSGARWKFKQWYIATVIDCFTTTLTIPVTGVWTAYAIYTKQYYLMIKTTPPSIKGMAGVQFTGEGWYDENAPWTVTALNTTIMVDAGTKYIFVMWDFTESGGSTFTTPSVSWIANQAWNGTAVYKKQYRATFTSDPGSTGTTNLNIWNLWPILGGEAWADENNLVYWGAGSGPVAGFPFDYYFDHWTVNGVDQTQYMSAFNLNFTGPKTTVAHYLGKSAFFITPQTVLKNVPAYCTTFDLNVTAANLVDLYGIDFNVTWNKDLLELVNVKTYVTEIWNTSYIAISDNSTLGNYHFVATALAPTKGFNGTHTIVTLTFHIIYDPCYISPYYKSCVIGLVGPALGGTYPQLSDSLGNGMLPWNCHGGSYEIDAVKPTLYMKESTVTKSQKDATFTVEIWIRNATKLSDWWTTITYSSTLLDVTNVVLDTTFLTGPYSINIVNFATSGQVKIEVAQLLPGNPANGTGRLATIYFHVKQSIFWTTAYPTLGCTIQFNTVPAPPITGTGISVMCPTKNYAYAPTDVGVENCVYKYVPIPGDVNMDGVVNVLDLKLVADDYGSSTTYDLNISGKVDLLDIVLVAINYGRTTP